MEYIKLIGVLIIIVGFILKFDTTATVVIAGLVTALVSNMSITEFLTTLGEVFTSQRIVSLFFLTLPMIGIVEVYGLKQQAVRVIEKLKGLTTGTFYTIYILIRTIAAAFSIRIGGHATFIRPLIYPMGEAAARAKYGDLDEKEVDRLKSRAAALDNYGNFFGQNVFVGSSGLLLILGVLQEQGYDANLADLAKASVPAAILIVIVSAVFNKLYDMQLDSKYGRKEK